LVELEQQRRKVDAAVLRRVRREPALRLCELALAADAVPTTGLVPGDSDVNEALQEVALRRLSRTPRVLELFVRSEVLAGADQRQAARERVSRGRNLRPL
jgi:hypothetical protein